MSLQNYHPDKSKYYMFQPKSECEIPDSALEEPNEVETGNMDLPYRWRKGFPDNKTETFPATGQVIPNLNNRVGQLCDNNYKEFKKIAESYDTNTVEKILIESAKFGIIRNIEYLLPIVMFNDMVPAMNDALVAAAENCHIAVMDLLVSNGADIHYKNDHPLRVAVEEGHNDAVISLIKQGANIHLENGKLLYYCCLKDDNDDVLDTLIQNGIDVFKFYQLAVNCCLTYKHGRCMSILVKNSVNKLPETKNDFSYTAEPPYSDEFLYSNKPAYSDAPTDYYYNDFGEMIFGTDPNKKSLPSTSYDKKLPLPDRGFCDNNLPQTDRGFWDNELPLTNRGFYDNKTAVSTLERAGTATAKVDRGFWDNKPAASTLERAGTANAKVDRGLSGSETGGSTLEGTDLSLTRKIDRGFLDNRPAGSTLERAGTATAKVDRGFYDDKPADPTSVNSSNSNYRTEALGETLVRTVKNNAKIDGYRDSIKFLIKAGADVHYKNDLPLRTAVEAGNNEAVTILINEGADIHLENGKLLYYCCINGDNVDILNTLIKHGIDVFQFYQMAVDVCLAKQHTRCMAVLVKHSITKLPETRNDFSYTDEQQDYFNYDDGDEVVLLDDNDDYDGNNNNSVPDFE